MMKKLLVFLLALTFIFASEGPKSPATTTDNAGVGTVTWSNPNNSQASDNSYATAVLTVINAQSHYIKATNFSFSAVTGTVDGIVVGVERKQSVVGGDAADAAVNIVKGGTIGATDKSTLTSYPTSDTYEDHGGATDKWGETWVASDITGSTFGTAFSSQVADFAATISVDHIRITVYYTASASNYRKRVIGYNNGGSEYEIFVCGQWYPDVTVN